MEMNDHRTHNSEGVEITGLGAVTPIGGDVESFWRSLTEGRQGFAPIRLFSTEGHRTHVGAEVRGPAAMDLRRVDEDLLSRADVLALLAASEALTHARLLETSKGCVTAPGRIGIVVGTAAGGILGLERFFRKRAFEQPVASPRRLLSSFCLSAVATNLAREFVIQGPRMTIATVCSSSGLALAAGKELLEAEDLDYVLVVGTETLSEVTLAGFNSLRSVAPERCRPFDLNRKGLVLGEGAGAMVLERATSVRARNVRSLACLRGYGLTTDLHHFTAPQPQGDAIAKTIGQALTETDAAPTEVHYVNAHGTATPLNDEAETRGLKKALGPWARKIAVSSIKSMIGHALGAASVLEAVATVLSVSRGVAPPTANLETPDPECDLDYVPNRSRRLDIPCALSNSFAFGGSNISLVFSRSPAEDRSEKARLRGPLHIPVITGIGLVTPIGVGLEAFKRGLAEGRSGLSSLEPVGAEWAGFRGGLVDTSHVRDKIPVNIRRRLNRQASFLMVSLEEAMADAGLDPGQEGKRAFVYGSAFGCSGNVHRFYSQLLADGPKFASPQEFNMSVTNAPPAMVAQNLGLHGPIWVFVADEASWDHALHWGAMLIQQGRAEQVLVSAAEEVSESIVAIHQELGLLKGEGREGLELGEGAVTMVIESHGSALARGAGVYGTLTAWNTQQDPECGPVEYSSCRGALLEAALTCLQPVRDREGAILCMTPENGTEAMATLVSEVSRGLDALYPERTRRVSFLAPFGESGLSGGLGLAVALLEKNDTAYTHALVLASARGGVNAATLVEIPNPGFIGKA
jgi:3-oxoacyl-[acyl-carrier-protein] synthase II